MPDGSIYIYFYNKNLIKVPQVILSSPENYALKNLAKQVCKKAHEILYAPNNVINSIIDEINKDENK